MNNATIKAGLVIAALIAGVGSLKLVKWAKAYFG